VTLHEDLVLAGLDVRVSPFHIAYMRNQVGFAINAVIGEHPGDRREAHPGLDLDRESACRCGVAIFGIVKRAETNQTTTQIRMAITPSTIASAVRNERLDIWCRGDYLRL